MKPQRLLLNLFALILLAFAAVLVVQNLATSVSLQFLSMTFPAVPLGIVALIGALLAGGGTFLKMWERVIASGQQQRRAGRELERREVSQEEAEAKVKVLENKVQTLEKALREALKASEAR
jgi:hypothetical protein